MTDMNKRLAVANKLFRGFLNTFNPFSGDSKRPTAWSDYGYPRHLNFDDYWSMYKRNGIAYAGVVRHVEKTWSSYPRLVESKEHHDETDWEQQLAKFIRKTRMWKMLRGADERNRVGRYSAVIFIFADNKKLYQPVTRVPGGFDGLVRMIPVFESQLEPIDWDMDTNSPDYGMPTMYYFQENDIGDRNEKTAGRSVRVHPDRVHIWAEGADDGSIYGKPALESGYNALITMEKIVGAGGEGFWKTARAPLKMDIDKDADARDLARILDTDVEGIADKMDEIVADFYAGLDKSLLTQGMKTENLRIELPNPKEFFLTALQEFAASMSIPLPVLLGHQTGERASSQDSLEWASTIMSRRESFVLIEVETIIDRLMKYGIIPEKEYHIDWGDLTEQSFNQKLENAKIMSEINRNHIGSGTGVIYSREDVRDATGLPIKAEELDDIDDLLEESAGVGKSPAPDPDLVIDPAAPPAEE